MDLMLHLDKFKGAPLRGSKHGSLDCLKRKMVMTGGEEPKAGERDKRGKRQEGQGGCVRGERCVGEDKPVFVGILASIV